MNRDEWGKAGNKSGQVAGYKPTREVRVRIDGKNRRQGDNKSYRVRTEANDIGTATASITVWS